MAIPDADINPTATGEALKTAKEHEQPAEVTFYAGELFRGCVRIRETKADGKDGSVHSCIGFGSHLRRKRFLTVSVRCIWSRHNSTSPRI